MDNSQLDDAPIQPEFYQKMNDLAKLLDKFFNGETKGKDRENGFILLVYPFGNLASGNARCNYISNGADRRDVITLMKEMIARFEGQPEQSGRA